MMDISIDSSHKLFSLLVLLSISMPFSQASSSKSKLKNCHLRELELCFVGSTALFRNPNGIPTGEAQLKRQCEIFRESTDCYENYANQCLTKYQHSFLLLFGIDFSRLQQDFCKQGTELWSNYTKQAPCLRQVLMRHQHGCVSDLQVSLEPIHKMPLSTRMQLVCCNVNKFKSCILDQIDENCGEEAYDFATAIIRRVAGNAMGILCRHYDEDFNGCRKFLPEPGSKPHVGRNTSAISRLLSGFANWRFVIVP